MIFLTVGHQTPFDRLVKAMDEWAACNPQEAVYAQIGEGHYLPRNFSYDRWLNADAFNEALASCESIVAHAGTGTIIEALQRGKPMLVLPRVAALGETRNDHQVGTARYFAQAGLVKAIETESDLSCGMLELKSWRPDKEIASGASPALLDRLAKFIKEVEGVN